MQKKSQKLKALVLLEKRCNAAKGNRGILHILWIAVLTIANDKSKASGSEKPAWSTSKKVAYFNPSVFYIRPLTQRQ